MFLGTLTVSYPDMNEVGVPPGPLVVFGYFTDRGMPEPDPVSRITISLDGGPVTSAEITHTSPAGASVLAGTFQSPAGSFTVADGAHTLTVTATDTQGSKTEVVPFTVGPPPVNTTLTNGACYCKSAVGFGSPAAAELRFWQPSSVAITSLPTITAPPFSDSGFTENITITWISSGIGTFNSADGSITIPDVEFRVDASITYGPVNLTNSATVSVVLTTGSSWSPSFNDAGIPLEPSGAIGLVGDGTYSTPIFGLTDFGISLQGTFSPIP
jgi:hypothetical protein